MRWNQQSLHGSYPKISEYVKLPSVAMVATINASRVARERSTLGSGQLNNQDRTSHMTRICARTVSELSIKLTDVANVIKVIN